MQRGEASVTELWKKLYQGKFFYQLYFQKEGIAEADIPRALRTMYYAISGDCLEHSWEQLMTSKGPDDNLLGSMPDPNPLPEWLTDEDLQYFVDAYKLSGFRGSLNRYRA